MIELRLLRPAQHQADSAAVEKREPGRNLEQQLQPQRILIKSGGALHIVRVDRNLSDARNSGSSGSHGGVLTSRSILVSIANYISMRKSSLPFDALTVADRLHSAAIHLLRRVRKQDAATGEGPARLSALSVLVFGGPKTLGELAAAEQVKPPTMSRIVAGLKQSGLAKVQNDGQDARRITISVTAKGERLLQEARKRRIQVLAENLKNLSEADLKTLSKAAALIEKTI